MTISTFLARCFREAARRIDATKAPDEASRLSLANSAARVHAAADVLDPRVHRCVVCDEMLSTAMTEAHMCPAAAAEAFDARARAWAEAGGVEA